MAENVIVKLARETIAHFVKTGKVLAAPDPLPPELSGRAGVFVSLKKRGSLRGCIGTFAPTTKNLAEEIIRNAIESAAHDPRFSPVRDDELGELEISVDILTPPEPVASPAELDAKQYGVIVKAGGRRGLLLPDLPGVNSPEQQIEICRAKGGIAAEAKVELYRFEVKRYKSEKNSRPS